MTETEDLHTVYIEPGVERWVWIDDLPLKGVQAITQDEGDPPYLFTIELHVKAIEKRHKP